MRSVNLGEPVWENRSLGILKREKRDEAKGRSARHGNTVLCLSRCLLGQSKDRLWLAPYSRAAERPPKDAMDRQIEITLVVGV